jgi:serine/threonine protein kinase
MLRKLTHPHIIRMIDVHFDVWYPLQPHAAQKAQLTSAAAHGFISAPASAPPSASAGPEPAASAPVGFSSFTGPLPSCPPNCSCSYQTVMQVLELCARGDLFDLIRYGGPLPESLARTLMGQLVEALEHCHSAGIVHSDLKPEQILFDSMWRLKVCVRRQTRTRRTIVCCR